jgi:hypothetical protein
MRKYAEVWNTLKTTGTVEFTVTVGGFRRIWNGIKLEKTIENTARRDVGLSMYPKLDLIKTPLSATHIKVTLRFHNNIITTDATKL